MTITITPDETFTPPRNQIDVSVPADNVMTSVNVWRNDLFGRQLVRTQPSAGFESRTVYDYEAPYGRSVTYDWTATYYDPADNATTFSEPWTSFPGSWTGNTAQSSIASNRVTLEGSDVYRSILRSSLTADWDTITVSYLDCEAFGNIVYGVIFEIGSTVLVLASEGGLLRIQRSTGLTTTATPTSIDAGEPFTIIRSGSTLTIAGTGGSITLTSSLSIGTLTAVRIEAGAISDSPTETVVGAITASTFADTLTLAEESTTATLNPAQAWIVAPQAPALSFPLSNTNQQTAGIRELAPVTNSSNTTVHRILGTSTPLTTTTGNRQADTLTATVYTHTSQERQALRALLAPDVPVLVNVPEDWALEFDYAFYQVGDVTESRPYTLGDIPMRDFTLPLTRVRSPEVDVENPGWSYAQVATEISTYTELRATFATYADLAVNNRV